MSYVFNGFEEILGLDHRTHNHYINFVDFPVTESCLDRTYVRYKNPPIVLTSISWEDLS